MGCSSSKSMELSPTHLLGERLQTLANRLHPLRPLTPHERQLVQSLDTVSTYRSLCPLLRTYLSPHAFHTLKEALHGKN